MELIFKQLEEIKQILLFNKNVWTLQEFCSYADISLDHGYRLTSSGKIKFFRPFGKKIFIDREDAIEALKQNPVTNAATIDRATQNNLMKQKKY
jgi:excisionase family DNA binding protein